MTKTRLNNIRQHWLHYLTYLAIGVALIDITYPHNWINLSKEYHMMVLTFFNEDETDQKKNITGDAKTKGLFFGMDNVENFILRTNSVEPVQVERFYV